MVSHAPNNKYRTEGPRLLVFLGTQMHSLSGSAMVGFFWTLGVAVRIIYPVNGVRTFKLVITVGADARRVAWDGWPANRIVATDIVPGMPQPRTASTIVSACSD